MPKSWDYFVYDWHFHLRPKEDPSFNWNALLCTRDSIIHVSFPAFVALYQSAWRVMKLPVQRSMSSSCAVILGASFVKSLCLIGFGFESRRGSAHGRLALHCTSRAKAFIPKAKLSERQTGELMLHPTSGFFQVLADELKKRDLFHHDGW